MLDSRDDFIISIRYALLKKGAKQKFSLFFLISLSVLIITLDKFSVPFIQATRAVINDIVYEVTVVTSIPSVFISYLEIKKEKHFNIVNKNKILENEIKTLKSNRYKSLFLKTENESLKKALNLKNQKTKEKQISIVARVLFDQESPFLKSFIINKGKKDGIIKGMTVFSKSFLVGKVIESNYLTSRVLLVTDLNSKIPVVIQDSGVNAILAGEGKKMGLSLEFLPDAFVLEPNKIIYTSGKDGFLTAGLPVAETYLNKKNELKVKSLTDPQQASIIHVTSGQIKN